MNNEIIKLHLTSALQTFLATFFSAVGLTLSNGDIAWTGAFWTALLLMAVRSAIKEVFARFAPIPLGGRVGPTLLGNRKS